MWVRAWSYTDAPACNSWSWVALTTPLLPAEALAEPELCYVLDAVLFTYGIILTVLYCRLKVSLWGPGHSLLSLGDPSQAAAWGAEGYSVSPSTPETAMGLRGSISSVVRGWLGDKGLCGVKLGEPQQSSSAGGAVDPDRGALAELWGKLAQPISHQPALLGSCF
uniref:Uncharacterized protein n=1 Tax=Chelydra serpentina TaxID=8475 RepID=A0A8C3SD57_CHESE